MKKLNINKKKVKKIATLVLAVILLLILPVSRSSYMPWIDDPGTSGNPTVNPGTSGEVEIAEDGIYDTKDEVALYLYTYHKLPSNYMTKNKARKKGWENGALNTVVPGKCIGGDYYGNYEGVLPDDVEYHECDIDTINSRSRGSKRIVYSENWDIYYTEDHYETFELLYEGE